jgi:acetyltransferase
MEKVIAKNGREFLIRPIQKEDKQRLIDGLTKMSPESIHHRFLGFKKGFSEKELKHLTEVDGHNHFAIAVGVLTKENSLEGVGIGRYHINDNDPTTAEVAITIIDEYQGNGLGTKIMEHLIKIALENKITTFEGILETTNDSMIHLIKKLKGFKTIRTEDGVLKMIGDLSLY